MAFIKYVRKWELCIAASILLFTILPIARSATPSTPELEVSASPARTDSYWEHWSTIPLNAFAERPQPNGETINVYATAYVTWTANDDAQGVALISPSGKTLGIKLSVQNFCNAADESTVIVILNTGAEVTLSTDDKPAQKPIADCSGVFKTNIKLARVLAKKTFRLTPSDAPYGLGSDNDRLVPYRSIAVNKDSQLHFGTVLFIKNLAGEMITLPNGTKVKHDGYVMVADTGDMDYRGESKGKGKNKITIDYDQIDFFKGVTQNQTPPFLSGTHDLVTAVVVTDPIIIGALRAEHRCICSEKSP